MFLRQTSRAQFLPPSNPIEDRESPAMGPTPLEGLSASSFPAVNY